MWRKRSTARRAMSTRIKIIHPRHCELLVFCRSCCTAALFKTVNFALLQTSRQLPFCTMIVVVVTHKLLPCQSLVRTVIFMMPYARYFPRYSVPQQLVQFASSLAQATAATSITNHRRFGRSAMSSNSIDMCQRYVLISSISLPCHFCKLSSMWIYELGCPEKKCL